MAEYKYGVYGVIGNDIAQNASQAGMAPVYFGTAPVNLLSDPAGTVNVPVDAEEVPALGTVSITTG